MKALPGYLIVETIKNEESESPTGLYVAPSKDRPVKGTVISVGEQTATEGPHVKVGDIVFHKRWAGDELLESGKTYRFVKFSDCMALE